MSSAAFKSFLFSAPALICLVLLGAWNPRGDYWGSVEPPKAQCESYNVSYLRSASALTPAVYDHRKLDRFLREPQNTVSNVGYAVVGLAIIFAAQRRLSKSLGLACLFLAAGSGIYHASLLPEWRLLDIIGVYAALMSLAAVGAFSVFPILDSRKLDLIVAVAVWTFAVVAGIHRNDLHIGGLKPLDSKTVVIAAVAVGSIFALMVARRVLPSRHYILAISTLAISAPVAFFGGLADRFGGILAAPDALIQGHSLWHGLGAVALLAAYEAYSSTGFDRSVYQPTSSQRNQALEPTRL